MNVWTTIPYTAIQQPISVVVTTRKKIKNNYTIHIIFVSEFFYYIIVNIGTLRQIHVFQKKQSIQLVHFLMVLLICLMNVYLILV
jgi:hypothetical protein